MAIDQANELADLFVSLRTRIAVVERKMSTLTPSLTTDTYTAATQAAMLALPAKKGDLCIRTDVDKSFILTAEPATVLGNWTEMPSPEVGPIVDAAIAEHEADLLTHAHFLTVTEASALFEPVGSGGTSLANHIAALDPHPNAGYLNKNQADGYYVNVAGDTMIGDLVVPRLTVNGDLTVNGTSVIVNSTITTLDDPILTVGGDVPPISNDAKDRGIEFRWHDGAQARVGFFGFQRSSQQLTFIPMGTNTGEVFSGTKGYINAYVDWTNIQSKPNSIISVTLTGAISGTGQATMTALGSASLNFATTLAANSITLGTDTIGNYVATVAGTPSQVVVSGSGTEGATVSLSLPQNIHAAATPTFDRLTLGTLTSPPLVVGSTQKVLNLNADLLDDQSGDFYRTLGNAIGNLPQANLAGAYPNVTGLGTLTSLAVGGSMTVTGAATFAVTPSIGWSTVDPFTRANSTTSLGSTPSGEPWTAWTGTWGISANQAYLVAGTGDQQNVAVIEAHTGEVAVQVTLAVFAAEMGVVFRGVDNLNYMMAKADGTTLTFFKRAAGAFTAVATRATAGAWASGDSLRVVVSPGSSIQGYRNGVAVGAAFVDATHASGTKAGLRYYGGGIGRFDSFDATSTVGGGAPFWTATNDGPGSGLHADLLDNRHGDDFALSTTVEALLGDIFFVGLYNPATWVPGNPATLPKPDPVYWKPGSATYRNGMYWLVTSTVVGSPQRIEVDFIDSDASGRYDATDDVVTLTNGDWIICKDPNIVANGPGKDLTQAQIVFQLIPQSADNLIRQLIAAHNDEAFPHAAARFMRRSPAAGTTANLIADDVFEKIGHTHAGDINEALIAHKADVNPHLVAGYVKMPDVRSYAAPVTHVHPQYESSGAIAAHNADPLAHAQKLDIAVAEATYATKVHFHDERYAKLTDIPNVEDEVRATDGAQSARMWIGSVAPANPGIGDLWYETFDISLTPPSFPANVQGSASGTAITITWNDWPIAMSVDRVRLQRRNGANWTTILPTTLLDYIIPPSPGPLPTSYTDSGLTENTTYEYRLWGTNEIGSSDYAYKTVAVGNMPAAAAERVDDPDEDGVDDAPRLDRPGHVPRSARLRALRGDDGGPGRRVHQQRLLRLRRADREHRLLVHGPFSRCRGPVLDAGHIGGLRDNDDIERSTTVPDRGRSERHHAQPGDADVVAGRRPFRLQAVPAVPQRRRGRHDWRLVVRLHRSRLRHRLQTGGPHRGPAGRPVGRQRGGQLRQHHDRTEPGHDPAERRHRRLLEARRHLVRQHGVPVHDQRRHRLGRRLLQHQRHRLDAVLVRGDGRRQPGVHARRDRRGRQHRLRPRPPARQQQQLALRRLVRLHPGVIAVLRHRSTIGLMAQHELGHLERSRQQRPVPGVLRVSGVETATGCGPTATGSVRSPGRSSPPPPCGCTGAAAATTSTTR